MSMCPFSYLKEAVHVLIQLLAKTKAMPSFYDGRQFELVVGDVLLVSTSYGSI